MCAATDEADADAGVTDIDQPTTPTTGSGPPTTDRSYATLFQSKDDQGQWFVVTRDKTKPTIVSRIITGKGSGSGNSSLKAAVPPNKKPRTWHCSSVFWQNLASHIFEYNEFMNYFHLLCFDLLCTGLRCHKT